MGITIATTDEVVKILALDESKKERVDYLLGLVTNALREVAKNNFVVPGIYVQSSQLIFSGNTITAESTIDFEDELFFAEDIIVVTGSARNSKIGLFEITQVDGNVLTVKEDLKPENFGWKITIQKVEYPDSLKLLFADIIRFYTDEDRDKTSVSIGDYSASYGEKKTLLDKIGIGVSSLSKKIKW